MRGTIQREGVVVHVVTERIDLLTVDAIAVRSRDFHGAASSASSLADGPFGSLIG